jgi:hypothetical protein
MLDDGKSCWNIMSARQRVQPSRPVSRVTADAKIKSLAHIEKTWKVLDRARFDLVIHYHCHRPDELAMNRFVTQPAAAARRPDEDAQAALGNLVITSAELEALLGANNRARHIPASWMAVRPTQGGHGPLAEGSAADDPSSPAYPMEDNDIGQE